MQNNYFDTVDVDKIKDCQTKMQEDLRDRKADLLNKIKAEGKVSDEIAEELKTTIGEFIDTYK